MEATEARTSSDTARRLARSVLKNAGQTSPPTVLREVFKYITKKHPIVVEATKGFEKVDGAQLTKGANTVIVYNSANPIVRQRFTLAHELGHCLLGHTRNNRPISLASNDPTEFEANQFAAELLMPRDQLLTDIKVGIQDASALAARYQVSEDAMWWRLQGAGLLKEMRA